MEDRERPQTGTRRSGGSFELPYRDHSADPRYEERSTWLSWAKPAAARAVSAESKLGTRSNFVSLFRAFFACGWRLSPSPFVPSLPGTRGEERPACQSNIRALNNCEWPRISSAISPRCVPRSDDTPPFLAVTRCFLPSVSRGYLRMLC